MKTLQHGSAKLGIRTAAEELVQLNQQLVVRILSLYDFHGGLVPHTAAASFQIDAHGLLVWKTRGCELQV